MSEPKIVNWDRRGFGNDYTFDPINGGTRGRMMGWRLGLSQGDVLVLHHTEGFAAYVIEEITYYRNPRDMFRASVRYEPGLVDMSEGQPTLAREI